MRTHLALLAVAAVAAVSADTADYDRNDVVVDGYGKKALYKDSDNGYGKKPARKGHSKSYRDDSDDHDGYSDDKPKRKSYDNKDSDDKGYGKPKSKGYGDDDSKDDDNYGKPKSKGYDNSDDKGKNYGKSKGRKKGYSDDSDGYSQYKYDADNYHDKYSKRTYRNYDGYPTNSYDRSPYGYDDTPDHDITSSGYDHHYPVRIAPEAHIKFPDEGKIRLPRFNHYHCFLNAAPWTSCGGRSLRDYFMDQCFSMYYSMTAAADGICSQYHHKHNRDWDNKYNDYRKSRSLLSDEVLMDEEARIDEDILLNEDAYKQPSKDSGYGKKDDGYGKKETGYGKKDDNYKKPKTEYKKPAPTPKKTPAPNTCSPYQQEKCLQEVYTSITLAMVQCLTENTIRILYIEKFASVAETNPIEGPILYLKKIHSFIKKVIDCNKDKLGNYPTLWRSFSKNFGKYNPMAPYRVEGGGRISLPTCASEDATGWDDTVIGHRITCNNVEDLTYINKGFLDDSFYKKDPSDITYSMYQLSLDKPDGYCNSYGLFYVLDAKSDILLKKCTSRDAWGNLILNYALTNPDSLRGLLDGRNVFGYNHDVNIRVRTLAEIAAFNSGLHRQPILEGNGVLYYCAFYACIANNDGDASSCLGSGSDWKLSSTQYSVEDINAYTDFIQDCKDDGFVDTDDFNELSKDFIDSLQQRTHLCIAENEIMSFYKSTWGALDKSEDGHIVFLRKVTWEKCYVDTHKSCKNSDVYYDNMVTVLKQIKNRCLSNKHEYEAKTHSEPKSKPRYDGHPDSRDSYSEYNTYKSPSYGKKYDSDDKGYKSSNDYSDDKRESDNHYGNGDSDDNKGYGKDSDDNKGYGKDSNDHDTYGKDSNDQDAYGKGSDDHKGYGKDSDDSNGYGRKGKSDKKGYGYRS